MSADVTRAHGLGTAHGPEPTGSGRHLHARGFRPFQGPAARQRKPSRPATACCGRVLRRQGREIPRVAEPASGRPPGV